MTKERKILYCLNAKSPSRVAEIAEDVDSSVNSVKWFIQKMVKRGVGIINVYGKGYMLTDDEYRKVLHSAGLE